MQNFSYSNPTRLHFGRGTENDAGRLAKEVLGRAGKALVIFGGGSARRSGLLNRVLSSLEAEGFTVIEKGGVTPNPRLSFVRETVDWMRDQGVSLIVAVGGGSVIDSAKLIAASLEYEGDAWDFFDGHAKIEKALPVLAVLTLSAAGSEQSIRCVISHHGTKDGIGVECLRPRAAIINPEIFATLPKHQIASGVVDMISHIMERYFSATDATAYIDAQAEAAMKTAFEYGPKVFADPKDYDSWCQVSLVGTFAHNGVFGLGRVEDWACHAIEHELSGWNEAIVHGMGLAVIIPAWMRYVSKSEPARFVQFARNVMGVEAGATDEETIERGIEKLCDFYRSLNMPLTLKDLGAADCPIESLARHCCRKGKVGHLKALDEADVLAIYRAAND